MIGTVVKTVQGAEQVLRLSTGAMKRLEAANGGKPISAYLEGLQEGQSITGLCKFFELVLNDGKGADPEAAEDFMDNVGGLMAGIEIFGEVLEAAFPDVVKAAGETKAASAGSPKPAGKKTPARKS